MILVGDVRNDLHRRPEIVTPPLLGDDVAVDASGGEVAVAAGLAADKAFVVAQIEIRFGTVLGHEDLTVLERAHGPRIHVDVGIQFHHAHMQAAGLQNGAQRGSGNTLAKGRNHAPGDEDESCHGPSTSAQKLKGQEASPRDCLDDPPPSGTFALRRYYNLPKELGGCQLEWLAIMCRKGRGSRPFSHPSCLLPRICRGEEFSQQVEFFP